MKSLRALHIEDSPADTKLIDLELHRAGYRVSSHRVETAGDMKAALREGTWDIILCDYSMPDFDALAALQVLKEAELDIPFIIVSGSIGDETAVEALKRGASDFIIKSNLARLGPAVGRELADLQTRKERREATRALQETLRARDEFLSIASHELKTPLASLRLQLQGLLRRVADAEASSISSADVRRKVQAADRSAERLGTLIERLLGITRLTSGRLQLRPERRDLVELVHASIATFGEAARQAGSALRLNAPKPVLGTWDEERLRSALDNLLDNALKYGLGRPIDVSVEDAGALARITVRDEGMGIEPADQERVFERFERAVPERHFGGFGLGLWLTRKIVEAHGGKISVQSGPGQGSVFAVELPKEVRSV